MSATQSLPFTTPGNYTFDANLIEISGGAARLRDQRELLGDGNATFHADYETDEDGNWGDGTLTGTLGGGATVASGRLNLLGGTGKVLDYTATGMINAERGCIRFKYRPGYTGNPAAEQKIFTFSNGNGSGSPGHNNQFHLHHDTASAWRWDARSNTGALLVNNQGFGTTVLTAGVTYEIEFNWDFTNGQHRLFIDGTQTGGTATSTMNRDDDLTSITHFEFGGLVGTDEADFEIEDVVWFDTVQHTANYTAGETIPATIYSLLNPTVKFNSTVNSSDLVSFSETVVKAGSDDIQHTIEVDGQERYWTGSAWADSNGTFAQTSDAGDIDTNVEALQTQRNNIVPISYLHSDDGSTTPELDLISFTYDIGLPDPTEPSLVSLSGFVYDMNGPLVGQKIKVRPLDNGVINGDVFQIYKYELIATTDVDGFFSGSVFQPPSGEKIDLLIGPQAYAVEIPAGSSFVDIADLTLTPLPEE